jgi:SAM-dependent methyltransferase
MKNPRYYTKELLKTVLPKYCKGDTVDVGAGHGKYKGLISKFCDSYTSVDNASSVYQFDEKSPKPDVVSDVLNMPLEDNQFDTAICTEVLEHVKDPFQLMKEIGRILKPGGYAIFSSGWATPYHKEPKDYWRFSADAYQLLCEQSGLRIEEIHRKGGLFSLLLYFTNRNIDLNTKKLKKVRAIFGRVNIVIERIVEKMDGIFKTEDTIGHLIVAKKI